MFTTLATKPSLTIKRRINAPPAKVYQAWTDPQKMMRWYAPADAETLRAEADARVGGRFRVLMRTADGEEHDVSGVYRGWCRTKSWCSLGSGARSPSGSPSSRSRSSATARAPS
jgi:hypothetical protein